MCGENCHVSKEQLVDEHLFRPGSPQFSQQNGKLAKGRSQLHGQDRFPQFSNNDQLFQTKDQEQQEMHHTCELCGSEGFNEDDLR